MPTSTFLEYTSKSHGLTVARLPIPIFPPPPGQNFTLLHQVSELVDGRCVPGQPVYANHIQPHLLYVLGELGEELGHVGALPLTQRRQLTAKHRIWVGET